MINRGTKGMVKAKYIHLLRKLDTLSEGSVLTLSESSSDRTKYLSGYLKYFFAKYNIAGYRLSHFKNTLMIKKLKGATESSIIELEDE